ncbi:MAG: hypothetical protein RLO21_19795 [Nitratireductor sp.]
MHELLTRASARNGAASMDVTEQAGADAGARMERAYDGAYAVTAR